MAKCEYNIAIVYLMRFKVYLMWCDGNLMFIKGGVSN